MTVRECRKRLIDRGWTGGGGMFTEKGKARASAIREEGKETKRLYLVAYGSTRRDARRRLVEAVEKLEGKEAT